MGFSKNLNTCWWGLRVGLGAAAFLAGLDKYFNLLTDWSVYVSPLATRFLPLSERTLMHLVGPVEMLVGIAILTNRTQIGAYVASAWLLAISLNLLTTGMFFDIAVRDAIMATAAFTLANLTEEREAARIARHLTSE